MSSQQAERQEPVIQDDQVQEPDIQEGEIRYDDEKQTFKFMKNNFIISVIKKNKMWYYTLYNEDNIYTGEKNLKNLYGLSNCH